MGIEDLKPYQWKPGQSGNQGNKGPRVTTVVKQLIKEYKLEKKFAITWVAMALGDKSLLDGRDPNFAWFKELIERLEGKVPDSIIDGSLAENIRAALREKAEARLAHRANGNGKKSGSGDR